MVETVVHQENDNDMDCRPNPRVSEEGGSPGGTGLDYGLKVCEIKIRHTNS